MALLRVHIMSALPPKADIGTQSWNARFVPKCMARPCGARWHSEIDERESCNNVLGLCSGAFCSGPAWVSARIQADQRKDLIGPFWHPVSWLRRADRSSISSFHLADLGRKVVQRAILRLTGVGARPGHPISGHCRIELRAVPPCFHSLRISNTGLLAIRASPSATLPSKSRRTPRRP